MIPSLHAAGCSSMVALAVAGCSLDYGQFSVESENASAGTGDTPGAGAAGVGAENSGASSSGGSSNGGTGNAAGGGAPNGGSSPGGSATGGSGSGGAGGGVNPLVSCTDQYGDVVEFQLCTESATECAFYYLMGNSLSCSEACGARGGECISMHNDGSPICNYGGPESCSGTNHNHAVCKCSAGCGAGGPCTAPQQCSGGVCM